MRKLIIATLIGASILAYADQWSFFYPESVKKVACNVQIVELSVNGVSHGEDKYLAEASAERVGLPNWAMAIGYFPPTIKGRHEALKACSKWIDEADRRMKASRK